MELRLVCQKCKHEFVLGRNALVVTPESVVESFGHRALFSSRTPGPNTLFDSPDLIDSCDWSTLGRKVIREQEAEVNRILSSLSRGAPRKWQCRKCGKTQAYPR